MLSSSQALVERRKPKKICALFEKQAAFERLRPPPAVRSGFGRRARSQTVPEPAPLGWSVKARGVAGGAPAWGGGCPHSRLRPTRERRRAGRGAGAAMAVPAPFPISCWHLLAPPPPPLAPSPGPAETGGGDTATGLAPAPSCRLVVSALLAVEPFEGTSALGANTYWAKPTSCAWRKSTGHLPAAPGRTASRTLGCFSISSRLCLNGDRPRWWRWSRDPHPQHQPGAGWARGGHPATPPKEPGASAQQELYGLNRFIACFKTKQVVVLAIWHHLWQGIMNINC